MQPLPFIPSAVFFDWDGTLVDSYPFLQKAHEHTLKTMGLYDGRHTGNWFFPYFGQPRAVIYEDLYGPRAAEAQKLFEVYFLENHCAHIEPLPGAGTLLEGLRRQGIVLGVVSNKRRMFVQREIDHLGWGEFFACLVGGGDAAADKPDAAPLFMAMDMAGLNRANSGLFYVGDTDADRGCAAHAGMPFLFFGKEGIGGELFFGNCRDLSDFLLQSAVKKSNKSL
ncbi:MAG: HAD family hydrolase [Alphaproteobacteria bacterium]|nr:HAD family hydrolase [Alphaproteobacteria bacterium]